VGDSSSMVAVA